MIKVAVLGGTGFGAGELLRLLVQHPKVEVVGVVSRSEGKVSDYHPHLRGFYDFKLTQRIPDEAELIISALPHGTSKESLPTDRRCIDLSSDLRFDGYYSLPEVSRRSLREERIVSNPGCLSSATILAFAPVANLAKKISVIGATGSSGAGRSLNDATHHPIRHSNMSPYKVFTHQHEEEIRFILGFKELDFVAVRAPLSRGILVTGFAELKEEVSEELYKNYYKNSPFIRIVETAEIENVVGSNFCDISIRVRGSTLFVACALDNLIKGMAGTAIQNLNLMYGFPETMGLWAPSVRPV
jgi:N-acetyl-gamma-glutamyl-phosphate reductase